MHWIKLIRLTIGLSQHQLGDYLKVSRSYAGYLENGKRAPSIWMIEKLMYLHRLITENGLAGKAAESPPSPQPVNPKLIRSLTNRAQLCSLSAELLSRKLATIVAAYQECQRILPIVKLVDENLPNDGDKKITQLWALIWKNDTDEKMKKCSIEKQCGLKVKIAVLTAEAEAVRKIIAELSI